MKHLSESGCSHERNITNPLRYAFYAFYSMNDTLAYQDSAADMTSTLRITPVLTGMMYSRSAHLSVCWMRYDRVLPTNKLPETAKFKRSAGGGMVTCHTSNGRKCSQSSNGILVMAKSVVNDSEALGKFGISMCVYVKCSHTVNSFGTQSCSSVRAGKAGRRL